MDETYNVLGIKGHLVGYQNSEPRTVEIFQIDPNSSLDFSLSAEPRHFIDHISTASTVCRGAGIELDTAIDSTLHNVSAKNFMLLVAYSETGSIEIHINNSGWAHSTPNPLIYVYLSHLAVD